MQKLCICFGLDIPKTHQISSSSLWNQSKVKLRADIYVGFLLLQYIYYIVCTIYPIAMVYLLP